MMQTATALSRQMGLTFMDDEEALDGEVAVIEEAINEQAIDVDEIVLNFGTDTEALAKFYIRRFFEGRRMSYGGPIPQTFLVAPGYVKLVLNSDICKGVDQAYFLMGRSGEVDDEIDENNVSPDTRLLVDTLDKCAKMGIPKCFASGIALMYMELCLGLKVRPTRGAAAL